MLMLSRITMVKSTVAINCKLEDLTAEYNLSFFILHEQNHLMNPGQY